VTQPQPWVNEANVALVTDLYELTMLQAYWHERMQGRAVFSLFFRRLPARRNYMVACGTGDVLDYLETLHFSSESLDHLAGLGRFSDAFLRWLADFRFTGDVHAMPEGTPVFPNEPLLQVEAPIAQAQLVESYLMNQVHLQTVLASKASRVVTAARGRPVVDFGLRRMHGVDAGIRGVRAYYVAGLAATSNVLAGQIYGMSVTGTMAHSYIQAHEDELHAFRAFAALYPDTTLLVDTYDTLEGVRRVIRLKEELGEAFRVSAIRLDSGDLARLAIESRELLDAAGMTDVRIVVSGGLSEEKVAEILERGAPVDGFGVGTHMGVSEDEPTLDLAYKLTEYEGVGRLKRSPGKATLPGRKQVFRIEEDGRALRDVIGRHDEQHPGRPLLRTVMRQGRRTPGGEVSLDAARERAADECRRLPERILALPPATRPYPVEISPALRAYTDETLRRLQATEAAGP